MTAVAVAVAVVVVVAVAVAVAAAGLVVVGIVFEVAVVSVFEGTTGAEAATVYGTERRGQT